MGLEFSEEMIDAASGRRRCLVITPVDHIRIGEGYRRSVGRDGLSDNDRRILAEARRRPANPPLSVCIFRGKNSTGTGSFGLDPELPSKMACEVGVRLLRGQTDVYRELIGLGICLFVHAEFDPRSVVALRSATEALIAELEAKTRAKHSVLDRLDLWVHRNLNLFLTVRFDRLVENVLPGKLDLMEKRMGRVAKLLELSRRS